MFFLLRIDLAMRALFWFHMKLKGVFSHFCEKGHWYLDGDSIEKGSTAIFTILILSNHEYGMFCYLFVSSYFVEQWFVVLLEEVVATVNGS